MPMYMAADDDGGDAGGDDEDEEDEWRNCVLCISSFLIS